MRRPGVGAGRRGALRAGLGGSVLLAPTNTVAPVISGTRGGTLSCTTGTWTGVPAPTYAYQWQSAATVGGGGSFSNIGGATASTYDDAATSPYDVKCIVTATNAAGAASANSNTLAAWLPSDLGAKLTLWLDQRGLTVTGAGYSDWQNQAGASVDFTQGTDANRPPNDTTINGFAAPHFDGVSDRMDSTSTLGDVVTATAFEFAAVLLADSLGADVTTANSRTAEAIFSSGGAAPIDMGITVQTSGMTVFIYDGANYRSSGYAAISAGAAALVTGRLDSGTLYCRVAADAEVNGTGGTISATTDTIRIGCNFNASAFADAKLATLIICNAVLSAAERAALRTYLAAKYAVTA